MPTELEMLMCSWALNNTRGAAEKKKFDVASNHANFPPKEGFEAVDVATVPVNEKIVALESILTETDGSAFAKNDIRALIAKLRA